MAIQAHMGDSNIIGGSQDWLFMSNNNQNIFNNTNNNNNMCFNEFSCSNNIQQQQQLQQQEVLLQLQQQYLVHLQNQQQKNTSCEKIINNNNNINNDGFMFLSTSKNNCTSTTTASTTTTTTGSDYYMRPMNFSASFADQLENQRQEIDRFITLQNERLKLALQEQRKQQLSTIMKKLEAKAMQLLTQKDDEIARATKRTIELQDIITKMEIENQEWQRLATQNEAMVISLNNKLEQVNNNNNKQGYCMTLSSSCESNEGDQDEESCCNVVNNKEVFNNNNNKGKEEIISGAHIKSVVLCKVCKVRKSCILLLPCRHLCCCKGCEPFIDACPVCKSVRMASIEALIS